MFKQLQQKKKRISSDLPNHSQQTDFTEQFYNTYLLFISKQRLSVFKTLSLNVMWYMQDDLDEYIALVVGFCLRGHEKNSKTKRTETLGFWGENAYTHVSQAADIIEI